MGQACLSTPHHHASVITRKQRSSNSSSSSSSPSPRVATAVVGKLLRGCKSFLARKEGKKGLTVTTTTTTTSTVTAATTTSAPPSDRASLSEVTSGMTPSSSGSSRSCAVVLSPLGRVARQLEDELGLSELPVIDLKEALEQCGSASFLADILRHFQTQFRQQKGTLTELARLDEWREFTSEVHSLRGVTAILCLQRMDVIFLRLIQLAKCCYATSPSLNHDHASPPSAVRERVFVLLRVLDGAFVDFESSLEGLQHSLPPSLPTTFAPSLQV